MNTECIAIRKGWSKKICSFGLKASNLNSFANQDSKSTYQEILQYFQKKFSSIVWVRTTVPTIQTPDGISFGKTKLIVEISLIQYNNILKWLKKEGLSLNDLVVKVDDDLWGRPNVDQQHYGELKNLYFEGYIFNVEENTIINSNEKEECTKNLRIEEWK